MIKIKIDGEKYKYDIYNIFKLFFHEIEFIGDENYDYNIFVAKNNLKIKDKDAEKICDFDAQLTIKENIKKNLYNYLSSKTGLEIPWGTLVGIRPSKIAINLINEGKTDEEIVEHYKYHSLTREDKARLCTKVAKAESNIINTKTKNISVYVGMPFCPTRCLYCSFISDTIENCKDVVDDYLKALNYEIEIISQYVRDKKLNIECVYFGGGTPTSIDDNQFENTMNKIYNCFVKGNQVKEFTVECGRPDSITVSKLRTLKKYGVQRISINPQTMNDSTLKLIGRGHNSKDVIDKFNLAREMGFDNINVDLIVGLPGEGLDEVKHTCCEVLKLAPDNLTVHGLSLKRGSMLHQNIINNVHMKIAPIDELNKMHEATSRLAEGLNLKPYYMYRQKNTVGNGNLENIGYSKVSQECIYNIEMIEERQTIIALGANAVSKIIFLEENRLERFPNHKDVREYIKRIEEKVEKKIKFLDELYGNSL